VVYDPISMQPFSTAQVSLFSTNNFPTPFCLYSGFTYQPSINPTFLVLHPNAVSRIDTSINQRVSNYLS